MAMCEDFPCCGHEQGCCPDFDESGKQLNMRCTCGAAVPLSSHSSICRDCRQALQDELDGYDDDDDFDDDDDDCDDDDDEEGGEYCNYCDAWEGDGCGCGEPNEGCCD